MDAADPLKPGHPALHGSHPKIFGPWKAAAGSPVVAEAAEQHAHEEVRGQICRQEVAKVDVEAEEPEVAAAVDGHVIALEEERTTRPLLPIPPPVEQKG